MREGIFPTERKKKSLLDIRQRKGKKKRIGRKLLLPNFQSVFWQYCLSSVRWNAVTRYLRSLHSRASLHFALPKMGLLTPHTRYPLSHLPVASSNPFTRNPVFNSFILFFFRHFTLYILFHLLLPTPSSYPFPHSFPSFFVFRLGLFFPVFDQASHSLSLVSLSYSI